MTSKAVQITMRRGSWKNLNDCKKYLLFNYFTDVYYLALQIANASFRFNLHATKDGSKPDDSLIFFLIMRIRRL